MLMHGISGQEDWTKLFGFLLSMFQLHSVSLWYKGQEEFSGSFFKLRIRIVSYEDFLAYDEDQKLWKMIHFLSFS